MRILVDSAYYIDVQRAGRDVRQPLLSWLTRGELYTCGVIRAEVLRGIVSPNIRSGMEAFFELVPHVPTDELLWSQAAGLAWKLDRSGIVLPLTDILIACCAMRVEASIVSSDPHFARIPGVSVRARL